MLNISKEPSTVPRPPPGFSNSSEPQSGTGSSYNSLDEHSDDASAHTALNNKQKDIEPERGALSDHSVASSAKEHYTVPQKKAGRQSGSDDKRAKKEHIPSHEDHKTRNKYESQYSTNNYEHDDGCKVFVGGIMLDDLDALRNTKDGLTDNPDVIAHIQKLKQERLLEIIKIFNRYGTITRVKQFLDNRHIFISFDNQSSAIAAMRDLQPLENRKRLIQDVRERLRIEGRQSLIAPRYHLPIYKY